MEAEETAEYETTILEDTSLSQGSSTSYRRRCRPGDIRLNEVWAVLRQVLPQADMEALTAEELEWIAWKEEQLARTGEEAGGGSLAIMPRPSGRRLTCISAPCWNILHDKSTGGRGSLPCPPRFCYTGEWYWAAYSGEAVSSAEMAWYSSGAMSRVRS